MELWITFALASTLILVIPGPTIILVITQSVSCGRRSVVPLVIGVLLGDFTAMTMSLLGLGAIMTTSAAVFTFFKWVGALYLFYLGFKMLKSKTAEYDDEKTYGENLETSHSLFRSSFIVTALNPKSIAFFVAFLPQFISPDKPIVAQSFVLGSTFLILATINAAIYAIFASQLKEKIRRESVQRWFNRCGGSALIGAGVITASMKQST